jgi:cytoskeletal protein RodZ
MDKKKIIIIAIAAIAIIGIAVGVVFATADKNADPETSSPSADVSVDAGLFNPEDFEPGKDIFSNETNYDESEESSKEDSKEPSKNTSENSTPSQTITNSSKPSTNTTTKAPTNTQKPVVTQKEEATTKKPATTKAETTTKKPTTTQSNKNEDLSKLGTDFYGDRARAGKYYDDNGNITTYNEIAEGEWYYYYDSDGFCTYKQKPYSKGNEPTTMDISKCHMCGKSCAEVNGEDACAHGGCTWWIKDVTCYYCGAKVPAHTCHTCKK